MNILRKSKRVSLYTNLPSDVHARIKDRVAELGHPHTVASVAASVLAEAFPDPSAIMKKAVKS